MNIEVLGSAAGGGVPQWNCGCANCNDARSGGGRVAPRSQDSIAVSDDGAGWLLCNASPDVAAQLARCSSLHPRVGRQSPIGAIVLTNGDVDHCVGLFSLRESQPLIIYATEAVWRGLAERNVLFKTLQRFPGQTTWRRLEVGASIEIEDGGGRPLGLMVTAYAVAGKRPVHLELDAAAGGDRQPSPEDNVGLVVNGHDGRRLGYVPSAAAVEPVLGMAGLDCLLFDGTFWTDDELIRLGLGTAHASQMAHLPIAGERGSLRELAGLAVGRKIYTHINNTNPMLQAGSAERRAAAAAGWEVAYDGMRLAL